MRLCPICGAELKKDNVKPYPLRHVIRCKTCGKLIKKKGNNWFLVIAIGIALFAANFKTHWIFIVLAIISAIALYICYAKLPYEPYDK